MPFHIESFFDTATGSGTHVVVDNTSAHAAVIDPVLDFDARSGTTKTLSLSKVIDFLQSNHLTLDWILETHAHADHLSGARLLKEKLGGMIAISKDIHQVQQAFKTVFNLDSSFAVDGSQFDHLFVDQEEFSIGNLRASAWSVPGHTPADMAYQIGDAVFVGDTLFMPDVGTARCDFPGGDANTLYQSIQQLLALPPQTRLFMCHDYPPDDRQFCLHTTVEAQRSNNIHVRDGINQSSFVEMRTKRDATLEAPQLLIPAIQVNIRAGAFPPKESNGVSYLKIPIDIL